MNPNCSACEVKKEENTLNSSMSIGSFLLMVILPKCPFCIMAYSSAITLCGGQDYYLSQNNWVSYIPSILSLIIIFLIARRNKGIKTYWSLTLATLGFLLIELAHQTYLSQEFYTFGTILSFLAIWLNGSLVAFTKQLGQLIKVQKHGETKIHIRP